MGYPYLHRQDLLLLLRLAGYIAQCGPDDGPCGFPEVLDVWSVLRKAHGVSADP